MANVFTVTEEQISEGMLLYSLKHAEKRTCTVTELMTPSDKSYHVPHIRAYHILTQNYDLNIIIKSWLEKRKPQCNTNHRLMIFR